MRNISNSVEKIKAHILYTIAIFRNIPFMRWCGKCGRVGNATQSNVIWRMRLACRMYYVVLWTTYIYLFPFYAYY